MSRRAGHREQVGREVHHEVWRVWPDNANEAVVQTKMTAEQAAEVRYSLSRETLSAALQAANDEHGGPAKHVVVKVVTTYEVVQR